MAKLIFTFLAFGQSISSAAAFVIPHGPLTSSSVQQQSRARKESRILASTEETQTLAARSSILGNIARIRSSPDDADESFLTTNEVPTFAAMDQDGSSLECNMKATSGGLEGVLRQGPAFVVEKLLSESTCNNLIHLFEDELGFGTYQTGKNHHGAMQVVVSSQTCEALSRALSRHVDMAAVNARRLEMDGPDEAGADVRLVYAGLNRRWRVYRYAPGTDQTFAPHIDAGFPPSSVLDNSYLKWDATDEYKGQDVVARLTVLMYLNEDFQGGETKFYAPAATSSATHDVLCSIRPQTGSVLIFPQAVGEEAVARARRHWPLHEGSPVVSGTRPKYVVRSDVLFVKETERMPPDDAYSKHDIPVRQAFMPRSSVFDSNFLHHVESLYNPHMGVENLGPLLYSLIRFTKKRQIVEIGAGYTSLWILQALRDNDEELERIRQLGRRGECLLLDIPWAVPNIVEQYDAAPSSLLLVDNCEHQKETATGATAAARALGLDECMTFSVGDAFALDLEPESVDLLWCDFGVGSRMPDFCRHAWPSLRPGGLLLCHSTLTNEGTRRWLEAVRSGTAREEATGIPQQSYAELSLLEPHKRYQNAITILQKRRATTTTSTTTTSATTDGDYYEEPIYSQYA